MTTPTVEEFKNEIVTFVQGLCVGEENKKKGGEAIAQALTTYGNARFEEGVKAERERTRNSKARLPTVHQVAKDGHINLYWEIDGGDFLDHIVDNK